MMRTWIAIAVSLLLVECAGAQTEILSSKYFDVYYPASRRGIAEQVAAYAQTELQEISRNLKLTSVKRITISILEEDEYNRQYGEHLPEWGIAFAIPDKNLIILIFPESFRNPSRLRFIIGHEIVHILIHRQAGVFIPRWFDEGVAMYLSREPNVIDEMKLLLAVAMGGIINLESIQRSFPETGRRAQLAYIESASTIVFLVEEFGPSCITHILNATREEHDFRSGFLKATGTDLPQFEMEWRLWIRKRFALTVLLRPNLLFAAAAFAALLIGLFSKLRRGRARSLDEGTEE